MSKIPRRLAQPAGRAGVTARVGAAAADAAGMGGSAGGRKQREAN